MNEAAPRVAVCADPPDDASLRQAAAEVAETYALPLIDAPSPVAAPLLLVRTPARLELRVVAGEPALVKGKPIAIDLTHLDTRSPAGRRLRQPLLKAVGIRKGEPYRPTVVDATAGFGEDAWLLAAMGCEVLAIERSAVMAALLRDALRRAAAREPDAAARLRVLHGDSAALLKRGLAGEAAAWAEPAVVYLDPMFPPGRKTVERRPMRVLRELVGEDPDAPALLEAALAVARKRVVVKRPRRAEPLRKTPTTSHAGTSVRYDVYVPGV